MKWRQRKTVNKVPTELPYVDLRGDPIDWAKYKDEIQNIYDFARQCSEHSEEYEELTMEEKLLVDVDMEYLKDECDMRYIASIRRKDLERCLARLRKRDRENDKRN